jgi:Zn-dependent peptidase ImmA (M78 family)
VLSIKVEVAPSILDWIGNGASFEGVDKKLLSHFDRWKAGEEQPTYAQIESLSHKIHIPLGYFFLKTPPQENPPILKFRTVNSAAVAEPSRNLIDTYYQMAAIQNWMRDYLIGQGNERLPFVGADNQNEQVEKIAASIRKIASLEEDWYLLSSNFSGSFSFLRSQFESIGILILRNGVVGQNSHRPLDTGEFRAFTLLDAYIPLIFINSRDTVSGQLFSLVHEIAHIWLGLSSFYNDNSGIAVNVNPLETLCNAVAAELLVPMRSFREEWKRHTQFSLDDKIDKIAKHYRCGGAVIARRALDNNYINNHEYQDIISDLMGLYKRNKAKQGAGGNYYDTAKSRFGGPFILALDNSIKEGKTTYTEAFALTGTNRVTFDNLVSKISGQA